MTRTRRPTTSTIKERSMTAISLLLLVGLFSTAGAIMAYYFLKNPDIFFADKARKALIKTPVYLQLEDGKFAIPDYLVHKIGRTTLRKVNKINLIVPLNWRANQSPVAFTSTSDLSKWLLAGIEKPTSSLSGPDRLNKIFRHYIDTPAIAHTSGLYRYRFKAGSPYEGIELFIDNLQTPKIIIRCELESASRGTRLCNRQLPISSRLTMLYKFPRSQLKRWQQLHQTMQNLLASIYQRTKE